MRGKETKESEIARELGWYSRKYPYPNSFKPNCSLYKQSSIDTFYRHNCDMIGKVTNLNSQLEDSFEDPSLLGRSTPELPMPPSFLTSFSPKSIYINNFIEMGTTLRDRAFHPIIREKLHYHSPRYPRNLSFGNTTYFNQKKQPQSEVQNTENSINESSINQQITSPEKINSYTNTDSTNKEYTKLQHIPQHSHKYEDKEKSKMLFEPNIILSTARNLKCPNKRRIEEKLPENLFTNAKLKEIKLREGEKSRKFYEIKNLTYATPKIKRLITNHPVRLDITSTSILPSIKLRLRYQMERKNLKHINRNNIPSENLH